MNVQELRIGNIVFDTKLKQPDVVICVEADGERVYLQNQGYTPIEAVEGVRLTKEWLLRFGFAGVQDFVDEDLLEIKYKDFDLEDTRMWVWLNGEVCIANNEHAKSKDFLSCYIARTIYVHQLQNLFAAITGEELVLDAEKETA